MHESHSKMLPIMTHRQPAVELLLVTIADEGLSHADTYFSFVLGVLGVLVVCRRVLRKFAPPASSRAAPLLDKFEGLCNAGGN